MGVFEDEVNACCWMPGVDWQLGAAGFENRENPDDHFQRTMNEQRNQSIGPDAKLQEMRGQRVSTAVQFGVGEDVSFESDGGVLRRSSDLLLNQPVKSPRFAGWKVRWLVVTIHNEAPMTSFMISLVPA